MILDGIKHVKLFGEEIIVAAKIVNFRGLSAHADKSGLLKWIGSYSPKPQKVFVIHGETSVVEAFSTTLTDLGHSVIAPNYRSKFDFMRNSLIDEGLRIEVVRKQEKIKPRKVSDAYVRLMESGDHLLKVIRENEGGANSDLAKFTSQILTLAMKWSKKKRNK
jgi:metallo-beta-lactamase family protein